MKKFLIVVISLVIFAMVAYGVAYLVMPVNSAELSKYTHSVSFIAKDAFIVRDEAVYYAKSDGVVYNIAADGDRVAQDEAISTIYDGEANSESLKKLHTLDLKINKLKERATDSKLYDTDSDSTESEIAAKMEELSEYAKTNAVSEIKAIKDEINNIRKNVTTSTEVQIELLNAERSSVENKISARKTDIISDRSGIFSSYVDGLETRLVPSVIEKMSPKDLKKLKPENSEYINGKRITAHTSVCKVMNNHVWYITGIADSDRVKLLQENPNVTVRFANLTETDVKGEVTYISEPDKGGKSIFTVKVSTYVESAFSYRNLDAEIIFSEYTGYKVPTDAIRKGEGISDYFVYARKGSESYKCDVEVLYSDNADGYSIIQSTKNADNKLGSMERLIVGER